MTGSYITPCKSICKVDPHLYVCEGCGRTVEEIRQWTKYSDQQRMDVMKRLGYGKRKKRNVDCNE